MKTSTVVIIAGAGLVLLYLVTRSGSTSLLGAPKAPTTSNSSLLSIFGGSALGAGIGSFFAGSSSKSPSSSSSGFLSGPTETPASIAQGNYLADATAASDDETGVVGFGGWDD